MKKNNSYQPLLSKKHAQPICWINDLTLIYYWRGRFVAFNVESKKEDLVGIIALSLKEKLLSLFSLTRRLFRLYIFSPAFFDKKQEILFSFNGYFCSFDLTTKVFCREQKLNHGARRLLSIHISNNGEAFYGEYPTKNDNQSVCIFKRNQNKEHSIVYRFMPGEIRHIHFINENNNDLYCFTGDENNETNIFRFTKKNFLTKPDRLLSGSQKYRSCVATFKNERLYYLTDNPYFENNLLVYNIKEYSTEQEFPVEGSVVYGLSSNDYLFFSTCVENNLAKCENGKNVILKIDGVTGGIRSKESILYCFVFNKNQLEDLMRMKKDCFSIKYFGFGTFLFTCNNSSKYLASFSQSLKRNETLFIFNIKN